MELKFKIQPYQTNAVNDVVDCFAGQPMTTRLSYRIDLGVESRTSQYEQIRTEAEYEGFKNADLGLTDMQILENIRQVQRRQKLPLSQTLTDFTVFEGNRGTRVSENAAYKENALAATRIHLDVEMETGGAYIRRCPTLEIPVLTGA